MTDLDTRQITLPLLTVPTVVLPGTVFTFTLTSDAARAAVAAASAGDGRLVLHNEAAGDIGVVARVPNSGAMPNGEMAAIVQAEVRARVHDRHPSERGSDHVSVTIVNEARPTPRVESATRELRVVLEEIAKLRGSRRLPEILRTIADPGQLADAVTTWGEADLAQQVAVLSALDVGERVDLVSTWAKQHLAELQVTAQIRADVTEGVDKQQREYLLRQQLEAIRKELGEGDAGGGSEIDILRGKLDDAKLPENVRKEADRELGRLEAIPSASPEYGVIRTWLQIISELPWAVLTQDHLDLKEARAILDRDHHGLDKVKRRIIEYLAVLKLKQKKPTPSKTEQRAVEQSAVLATSLPGAAMVVDAGKPAVPEDPQVVPGNPGEANVGGAGAILCFVGPPGVGKTSLGKSIAEAMGRKFIRVALGGVRDEADIRGHRRTYIGSMPGRLIAELRKAGVKNPVMMLDEIDKMSNDFRGDPAAAMLEVLDPAQNHTFTDHYLDVPFDLSKVLFIATANTMDTVPGPLRDRMEVIEIPGYTQSDKLSIAKSYLVPRQLDANGLTIKQVKFKDDALGSLIEGYTREAGVRNLERSIGSVIRAIAAEIVTGDKKSQTVDRADVEKYLGPIRFEPELAQRTSVPGVATGMAYTPFGGDILFIEATRMPGRGAITLTGQIGDVMKESATAAFSLIRSRSEKLGIDAKLLAESDIHIHVPAGAIPKDGPSAGTAMFTALASLLLNKPVRFDVAMTGEITLRGLVLPIGGLKEKTLAAMRAGIKEVIVPKRNEKDLPDIPAEVREHLKFNFVENIDQVLAIALTPVLKAGKLPAKKKHAAPIAVKADRVKVKGAAVGKGSRGKKRSRA